MRYAAKDTYTSLNYATEDMIGLVVLIQRGLDKEDITKAETIIQDWTTLTNEYGGTYYLPYYRYQTKEQFKESYPNWQNFKEAKVKRDPNDIFQNLFYNHYIK